MSVQFDQKPRPVTPSWSGELDAISRLGDVLFLPCASHTPGYRIAAGPCEIDRDRYPVVQRLLSVCARLLGRRPEKVTCRPSLRCGSTTTISSTFGKLPRQAH